MRYYVIRILFNPATGEDVRVFFEAMYPSEEGAINHCKRTNNKKKTVPWYSTWIEADGNPRSNDTLWFGMYKGRSIKEADLDYLIWLLHETDKCNHPIITNEVIRRAMEYTEYVGTHLKEAAREIEYYQKLYEIELENR